MGVINTVLGAFNRGIVSRLAQARVDIARIALSAETQRNWMPRVLGSMMLRPGLAYITSTKSHNRAKYLPFEFSTTDTALLELTDSVLRVLVNDAVVTRVSVSSAISNGAFDTNLTGWTDADESGATSSWLTGGYMSLVGTGFNAAIRRQQVTVAGGDVNKQHALRIVITRGPVLIRVGSSAGGDQYINETTLGTGTHSLTLTPTGDFHIQLFNRAQPASLVDSIAVEAAGVMELPTPWAEDDLSLIRIDQSGDILYIACVGHQQRKIERRINGSWSIVIYQPTDGPFRLDNLTPISLTPSALSGDITVSASSAYFKSSNVGALFRLTSIGQKVEVALSGDNQFSDPIRVTGIGASRNYAIVITGTWTATVTTQISIGEPGAWTDDTSYTSNTSVPTANDGYDNQIVYYRIGIKSGNYTSGTANASLTFAGGSRTGIVRVTGYTSETSVSAAVLSQLGGTSGSTDWAEGAWSDRRGWPSAVAFHDGRLWWAGKDKIYGSVSDAFESFDDTVEGDSGPISRSIGSGPVDTINWLLPMQRLIAGTDNAERSIRSSSLDEPLTPTNFNIKSPSTQGSARVAAIKVDETGVFVQRSNRRVYQLNIKSDIYSYDYTSNDLTLLAPDIGSPSIVALDSQRQIDTRIHCVRSDGTVAVLIFDPAESVQCWVEIESDGASGLIEDVVVLPGDIEDQVYYVVRRTIDGSTVRYLEKWALEEECRGGTVCKLADSHVVYSGSATTTITGLDHLEGEDVVVWADGVDAGTKTVSGGQITLDAAASDVVAGLYYDAQFKSTKLAYAAQAGTALTQRKRVNALGLILADTHAQGLQYGSDFDHLDDLPMVEDGADVDSDYVWDAYDKDAFEFDGTYDSDSRLCLQAAAPRPCTVLAAVLTISTFDKI